jgi:hypothetical protein
VDVELHPDAVEEWRTLLQNAPAEGRALVRAFDKLEVHGDRLPYPHSGAAAGATKLRELRPRAGRSPWRAFYRRIGLPIVVGAIGPEAESDPKGFAGAVHAAEQRLTTIESERREPL